MTAALEIFRRAFTRWAAAHCQTTEFKAGPTPLLDTLNERIDEHTQRLIGSAFLNGWLETEQTAGRGHFVRETDRNDKGGGQYMVTHIGNSRVAPCWESYIQLADYARLRTVAEPRGLKVQLEYHLMDITVWAGENLILYVENKVTRNQAQSLLKKVHGYGDTGFNLDDPDKGNDPLRKAKYLVRDHPKYFVLSATGFQQLFLIEYLGAENRFKLIEQSDPIVAPLYKTYDLVGVPPHPSAVDAFAIELDRFLGEHVWLSPGSGQTVLNAYLPAEHQDSIVLGVYKSGEVWTDIKALGSQLSERLANQLLPFGITLDVSKEWTYWTMDGRRFSLEDSDVAAIASAIADALLPLRQRSWS
jgi:hypothetical protein